jgi:hypothetical protein
VVHFELLPAANYDGWTSDAEHAYNDWVHGPFGDHSIFRWNSRTWAWQDQVPSNRVGLPVDGLITVNLGGADWSYQLVTQRDDVPAGGYSPGNTPKFDNVFRAHTTGWNSVAVRPIDLAPADQGQYESVNLLFTSNPTTDGEFSTEIRARYSDGPYDVLFRDPASGTAVNGGLRAGWNQSTATTAGVVQAFHTTSMFSQRGSDIVIRDGNAYMHTFETPLNTDPNRTLVGLDIVLHGTTNNRNSSTFVYGISGMPVTTSMSAIPEPVSVALLGLAGVAMLSCRRR